MKELVISGINLFEGGTLSIYYACLDELLEMNIKEVYNVTIFVHKKELFKKYEDNFKIIELPKSRKSYLYRVYYEYIYFYFYSKKRNIDIWFSLHDITPNVKSKKLYTYCHNPSPFYKAGVKDFKYSKFVFFSSFLYKYLYRINIKKNTSVIVQQEWIRDRFLEMYPIKNIIVARPEFQISEIKVDAEKAVGNKQIFIYAAFPRVFKNFEIICEAAQMLERERDDFEVWLTIDGSENKYSRDVYRKYKDCKSIKWLGIISKDEVFDRYKKSDCLIFPSKLETWGLPISEYKQFDKPIIMSDLPYAYETIGTYDKVLSFNADKSHELCLCMKKVIDGCVTYMSLTKKKVSNPYCDNWTELINEILMK